MIGAAIWYLPQGKELWTGDISIDALKNLFESDEPQKITLTKDHHFPRKVAAAELLNLTGLLFQALRKKSCNAIRIYTAVIILFCLKRINVLLNIRKELFLQAQKIHIERLGSIFVILLKNN